MKVKYRIQISSIIIILFLISLPMVALAAPLVTWPENIINTSYAPTNIIIADDGYSYVTNNSNGIMKYQSNGTLDTNWGTGGKAVETIRPIFLCFDQNGDILTGDADDLSGVFRVSAQTGESTIIIPDVRVGGIGVDSGNNIYVNAGSTLIKYSESFEIIWSKPLSGSQMGICILEDGSIFTTSELNGTLHKYTSEGDPDISFGTNGILDLSDNNIGFASYNDGLYVSCYVDGVIKKVSLDGKKVENVMTGTSPTTLVVKGDFYFITNWMHGSINCYGIPKFDEDSDQFNCEVTPTTLEPGSTGVVTLHISSLSTKEYEVTAKVYHKGTNDIAADISSSTSVLHEGDATITLTPSGDGWQEGEYYIEINLKESYFGLSLSNSFRVSDEIIIVDKHTVTFDTNGGSQINQLTDITHNSTIASPTNPSRTGYTFSGWYTNEELTTQWNFDEDTVEGDMTLYAKWMIKSYDVNFKDWDDTVIEVQSVEHGADAAAPNSPTRKGYRFIGWDNVFKNITKDLTVTAQYEEIEELVIAQDDLGANAEGLNDGVSFSEEELKQDVTVKLTVTVKEEKDVDDGDKSKVEEYASDHIDGDKKDILFLDISLFKVVGDTETAITNPSNKITISFVLPKNYRGKDFELLRVHEGVIESLPYTYDENTYTITFETDKFSTYSLAYGTTTNPNNIPETNDQRPLVMIVLALVLGVFLFIISRKKMSSE